MLNYQALTIEIIFIAPMLSGDPFLNLNPNGGGRGSHVRAWLHGMAGIPLPAPSLTLLLSALFGSLEEARKEKQYKEDR